MSDQHPHDDTPPEGEEAKAVWTIKRLVLAASGNAITDEAAQALFTVAKERLLDAMAQADVEAQGPPK